MRASPLLLLSSLLACNEQDFHKVTPGEDGSGPAIEVSPTYLDFGSLADDDDAVVRSFNIKSVGESDLGVESVTLEGEFESFTILTSPTAFVLSPGESTDIEVSFDPMGAAVSANAVVASDDPDNPSIPVELVGAGMVPELEIDPDPLDMGNTYVGCYKENTVKLTSVGTSTLRITDIAFSGDSFALLSSVSLPLDLEPGESTDLDLMFTPEGEAHFEASLVVSSNEPLGERTATQSGDGKFGAEYTDEWVVPTDPPTDIMFIVDQSGSMDDDQRALSANFSAFISALSAFSTDWQIIVANNDRGCNTTGILTPSTSGYETTFTAEVSDGSGTYIVDTEALLVPAYNGVDNTDSGECNDGFMREDALLHIVLVSDEPDQSGSWGSSDWEEYTNRIIAKKGSDALTRISAIAGDPPSGCAAAGNTAEYGAGYYEAAAATGGVFLSICSDWADSVEVLAEASVIDDTYELSHQPYAPSIVVTVNGAERTSGWTYDSATNTIVFDTDIPVDGDTVSASYGGEVTCD